MPLPTIQGEFRLTADPELRFAPSGMAVGNVRLVANSRKLENNEWVDDKVLFLDGVLFKQYAENAVESLEKGMLVIVTGRLQTEQWEKDGEKRSKVSLLIDHIAPSIQYATAKVTKTERKQGGGQQSSSGGGQQSRPAPADDPWATPAAQSDEPPF